MRKSEKHSNATLAVGQAMAEACARKMDERIETIGMFDGVTSTLINASEYLSTALGHHKVYWNRKTHDFT